MIAPIWFDEKPLGIGVGAAGASTRSSSRLFNGQTSMPPTAKTSPTADAISEISDLKSLAPVLDVFDPAVLCPVSQTHMTLSIRFYLFAEEGVKRISQRVMMNMAHGKDGMPQYAGTKQKVADIILEIESGKPLRIERAEGSFLRFDENGQVHNDLVASGFAALDTGLALQNALKNPSGKIVDLAPKFNREKWEREHRWTLSKEDLDLIADDIWGRKRVGAPKVERAKGAAPKPPQITSDARGALREIQTGISSLDNKLTWLNELSLKGVAHEARQNAKSDVDGPFWLAVAEAADRYREILVRRRTGRGVWYALVSILHWDAVRRTAETGASFHERCASKKEAEDAVRRLLAEHGKLFSADYTIEAEVLSELEWDDEGELRAT
jgi:hypothetical protein